MKLKFSDIFKTQNRSSLPAPACSSLYAIYFSNLLYACVRYICPFSSLSVCALFPDYKCRVTIRVIKCTPLRCHPSIVGCDEFAVLVVIYQYRSIWESRCRDANADCSIGFPLWGNVICNGVSVRRYLSHTPDIFLRKICIGIIIIRSALMCKNGFKRKDSGFPGIPVV